MENINLEHLQEKENVKIYSKDNDIYKNEKIEIYLITKENGEFYLSYDKKNSFDKEDILNLSFKNKIKTIGTPIKINKNNNLTNAEKNIIQVTGFMKNIITIGENLEGEYENGMRFTFPKIIQITKQKGQ